MEVRVIRSPGAARVTGSDSFLMWVMGTQLLDSGPLQEQYTLLTGQPSLQTLNTFYLGEGIMLSISVYSELLRYLAFR